MSTPPHFFPDNCLIYYLGIYTVWPNKFYIFPCTGIIFHPGVKSKLFTFVSPSGWVPGQGIEIRVLGFRIQDKTRLEKNGARGNMFITPPADSCVFAGAAH